MSLTVGYRCVRYIGRDFIAAARTPSKTTRLVILRSQLRLPGTTRNSQLHRGHDSLHVLQGLDGFGSEGNAAQESYSVSTRYTTLTFDGHPWMWRRFRAHQHRPALTTPTWSARRSDSD